MTGAAKGVEEKEQRRGERVPRRRERDGKRFGDAADLIDAARELALDIGEGGWWHVRQARRFA